MRPPRSGSRTPSTRRKPPTRSSPICTKASSPATTPSTRTARWPKRRRTASRVYNFRLSYVTDSELKSACELHSDIAQQRLPVTFWLKKLKDGKLVATDIQLDREAYQARQAAEAADGAAEEAPAEAETPEAAEPQAAETPEAE